MKAQFNFIFKFILVCCLSNITQQNIHGQCIDNSNYWEESWMSCNLDMSPNPIRGNSFWLLYEFTEPQAISTSKIWNANRIGESGMGAKQVYIDVSLDGHSWTPLRTEAFSWPRGTEAQDYEGFNGPNFEAYGFIHKVLFTVVSNYDNSNCVSIAEVKFNINPLACYGEEDACGICDGPGLLTWYEDADGDGLGNPSISTRACVPPVGYVDNDHDPCDTGLYGWADMAALFDENGCTGCHGSPGASGLDLTSYEAFSEGGNICGSNILAGNNLVNIININNYDGCSRPVSFPSMNQRVGGAISAEESAMIQAWIDAGAPYDCNCPEGAPDTDNDGICDASDQCPDFDNTLIGTPCDDGIACTVNDKYVSSCNCEGQLIPDSDFDGVCDELDLAPNNPCTADGIIGLPEPTDWIANLSNDCDQDGIPVEDHDQNDFDACIDDEGISMNPECRCQTEAVQAGGKLVASDGIWGTSAFYAQGLPDGNLTGGIWWRDYLELSFPYMEIGQEICVDLGFDSPDGGVQFEINELGTYKFYNSDTTLTNYEIQQYCFPVFVPGEQLIRVTRLVTGSIKVDGASFSYCPCDIGDPQYNFTSCQCPDDSSSEMGSLVQSAGFNDAQNADGLPDGNFTSWINGATDSLTLAFPEMEVGAEICVVLSFENTAGKVGFDLNGEYFEVVNPSGSTDRNDGQEICFKTTTSGSQLLKIKEEGSGSIWVDGSAYKFCNNNNCPDADNDGICDEEDICANGDDHIDTDGDGTPDACDNCNNNLTNTACDDGDACTTNDVYDANCNCTGIFADADNDGVCDVDDICPNGNDALDADGDGIPDACDDCDNNMIDTTCDDGNTCTIDDRYDDNCNCIGTLVDTDGDGVCDADDICANGDDNLDTDGDGTPDACDNCNNNLTNTACDDGDACTTNDVYDANCNCTGIFADADNDGVCDVDDICPNGNDALDADGDGIPDACDDCDNNMIDTACDDGDACTIDDRYDDNCNCIGILADADGDGVCDVDDLCPNGDDNIDIDNDGIPDACDDEYGSCTRVLTAFDDNPLTHSGTGEQSTTLNLSGVHQDITFQISDISSKSNGPTARHYAELVTVNYIDGGDNLQTYGTFSATEVSTINVTIEGIVKSITISLQDGIDGDSGSSQMSVSLGEVSSCESGQDCSDADGDGVCDANDACPGGDDTVDVDADGVPDACDYCIHVSNGFAFNTATLSHAGVGSNSATLDFVNHSDVTFTISDLDARVKGNPDNRYIDWVEVSYIDENGVTQLYGHYSGENHSSVEVFISGIVRRVIVNLRDNYSDTSPGVAVNLSEVEACKMTDPTPSIRGNIAEEKFDQSTTVSVFPNPSHDKFFMDIVSDKTQDFQFIITDVLGSEIHRQTIQISVGHNQIRIDAQDWIPGMYYVVLRSNTTRKIHPIVKVEP